MDCIGPTSTAPVDASLSDWDLEHEITRLAANINAVNYRFLVLLAEFDRRGTWADDGVRSCAHWLNWRCGLALGAAREKLRVAHALPDLPGVSEAFRSGALSFSKARAITRVATPDNEHILLSIARYGSTGHVENLVRKYRRSRRPYERDIEREQTARQQDRRQFDHHWDEDGSLVLYGRLPADMGAVLLKALEAAEEALEAPSEDVSAETSRFRCPAERLEGVRRNRRADALLLLAESRLTEAGARDRYQVVVHVDADVLGEKPDLPDSYLAEGPALPVDTVRRLCCDASLVKLGKSDGEVLDVGRKTRSIPPAIWRAVRLRDGGCRFPGCTATRHLQGHHVTHWADGGVTSVDNIVATCTHHHKLLHEGGFQVKRIDNAFSYFAPDGRCIDTVPALVADATAEVINSDLDEPIDNTTGWSWCGDRMDYSDAVEALQYVDPVFPFARFASAPNEENRCGGG